MKLTGTLREILAQLHTLRESGAVSAVLPLPRVWLVRSSAEVAEARQRLFAVVDEIEPEGAGGR